MIERVWRHACADHAVLVCIRVPAGRRHPREFWRCAECGRRWSTMDSHGPDRRPK